MDEARRAALNIWEFDEDENLLGLGEKGKKVMRNIANHLYKLHHAGYYCGELKDRVFIDPRNVYHISISYEMSRERVNTLYMYPKRQLSVSILCGYVVIQ
jgi:hypothetical protein